jgi:hypothetical protein
LRAARATIARANRANTEAVLPLIAYHRSYFEAGEATPEIAVDGLFKALSAAPASPSLRLALGTELVARGVAETARATLQPVATGAYDAPEREAARAALTKLNAN